MFASTQIPLDGQLIAVTAGVRAPLLSLTERAALSLRRGEKRRKAQPAKPSPGGPSPLRVGAPGAGSVSFNLEAVTHFAASSSTREPSDPPPIVVLLTEKPAPLNGHGSRASIIGPQS